MSQRKQRKKINQEGIDYWKSSSDLMTALILVLLLVIMFLVLYILDKPDEHFDQTYENTYESETDYEGGDGENIDDNIGDKDGESFSDDDGRDDDDGNNDDNGSAGGGGDGNDDGDYPGDGDGKKSAVLASLIDAETGKAILAKDVKFELYSDSNALNVLNTYYPDKKSYRTFKTREDGTFYLPEKVLSQSYYFHQLSELKDYDIADKVEFTIDKSYDWPDPFLVKIPMYPKRDIIRIQMVDKDNGQAVAGGEFEIIAQEDIVTKDDTVRVKKGDVAGTITCNEQGYGESARLYLGKYKVVQSGIPDYYSSNDSALDVTLEDSSSDDEEDEDSDGKSEDGEDKDDTAATADDKDEEKTAETVVNTVRAERTRIIFVLTDELTGTPVDGAVFNVDGPNINEELTTDDSGQIVLDEVEKNGKYVFTQVSAPGDYIASVDPVTVKVSAKGRIGNDAQAEVPATNKMLRLDIGVRDAVLRNHLVDMKVELFTENGTAVDAWTSNGSFTEITGLTEGKYYVNIDGDSSKKYPVSVTDTAEIQKFNINIFTMKSYAAIGGAAVAIVAVLIGVIALMGRARRRRKELAALEAVLGDSEVTEEMTEEIEATEETGQEE